MKHLNNFKNLKKNNLLNKEFLDSAFKELNIKFEFGKSIEGDYFIGKIKEPKLSGYVYNYEEYYDEVIDFYEFHKKIKEGLETITDEFSNKYNIEIVEKGENSIFSSYDKEINIMFYV